MTEPESTDEAAVISAVLDYFEGWFDGDASRMTGALHHALAKRALLADGQTLDETTAAWMIDATRRGVGRDVSRVDHRIQVTVHDIHGRIANVTVRSTVYREYVQLIRMTEGWKIINTLYTRT